MHREAEQKLDFLLIELRYAGAEWITGWLVLLGFMEALNEGSDDQLSQ